MKATRISKMWRVSVTICCRGEAKTPSMYAVDIDDNVKNTKTMIVAQQCLRGEFTSMATLQRA
jgi:hypothetical protein